MTLWIKSDGRTNVQQNAGASADLRMLIEMWLVNVFIRMRGIVQFEKTNRRHKEEDATRRS